MRNTQTRAASSGSRLSVFKALLFSLAAVGIWVFVNIDNLQEFIDTYQKREQEREQIEVLKQRIAKLKRQQQSLAYNGVESEKQIRERMGLHLPGEQVLFLKEEDATAAAVEKPAGSESDVLIPIAGESSGEEDGTAAQENSTSVNKRKTVK